MVYQIEVINRQNISLNRIRKIEADEWLIDGGCHLFSLDGEDIAAYPVNMCIVTVVLDDKLVKLS